MEIWRKTDDELEALIDEAPDEVAEAAMEELAERELERELYGTPDDTPSLGRPWWEFR